MLHLYLRVTDILFNYFESKLNGYDQSQIIRKIINKDHYYTKYVTFLKDKCKIVHPTLIKDNDIAIRKLSGDQKAKILDIFLKEESILSLFPNLEKKNGFNMVNFNFFEFIFV